MKREKTGYYLPLPGAEEKARAFVPNPLPPRPALVLNDCLRAKMDQVLLALGRLDSVSVLLPDTHLFLYSYIRKEAVLSSQIEGTQSSLSDLLLFELDGIPGVPLDDVQEVSNYVAALQYGLKRLREGFPLSLRLLKEVHGVLLSKGRGSDKSPGEFRAYQNWIGGSRPGLAAYVPPPPSHVLECMGDLEKFMRDKPQPTPLLLKVALAHAQFETIHPFLDGNGRIGRLLITLLLINDGVLHDPILYPSLHLKKNRSVYYELLQRSRTEGEWEAWIDFFLDALRATADEAVETARHLVRLGEKDRSKIADMGRIAGSALRIHHAMMKKPLLSVREAEKQTHLVPNTIAAVMERLESAGMLKEATGQKRNRVWIYKEYLQILNRGM